MAYVLTKNALWKACVQISFQPLYIHFYNIQDSWNLQNAFLTNSIWIISFIVLFAVILHASHSYCHVDKNIKMLKFCSSQTAGSYQLLGNKDLISKTGKTLNWISSGNFYHILHTWDCCIVLLIPWCLCFQHVVFLHHCTGSLRHTLKMVTIHSMHHPPFDWVKIQLEMLKVLSQHTYHCDTTVNNNMSIYW